MVALSAAFVTTALVATGCTTAPERDARYSSVEALRDAFVNAGGECPDWDQANQVTLAAESGVCSETSVLSIYLTQADRDELVANYKAFGFIEGTLLVGDNWVINDPNAKELSKRLGGTLVSTSGE